MAEASMTLSQGWQRTHVADALAEAGAEVEVAVAAGCLLVCCHDAEPAVAPASEAPWS